jgi:hypothetical protein
VADFKKNHGPFLFAATIRENTPTHADSGFSTALQSIFISVRKGCIFTEKIGSILCASTGRQ